MNEPIKITDLATLKREKQRLQIYTSFQEERIKDKFNSIKTNYKQIIGEEFLPFSSDINSKVSGALDWINDFVMGKILKVNMDGTDNKSKLSGGLLKIVEVLVIRLVSSFIKK